MKIRMNHLAPLLLLCCGSRTFALGVDKLSAELDASRGFKSVATFVVFNDDSDKPAFVTARALKWDADSKGTLTTTASQDLQIYPSVQKIAPGEQGTFKVRYAGPPVSDAEGNYRVFFTQIRLPSAGAASTQEGDLGMKVDQDVSVGLAMTVPVYVSDFSAKTDVLDQVSARLSQSGTSAKLDVRNNGNRHITITGYRLNGAQKPGLGVVLANHAREFQLEVGEPVKTLELDVSFRGRLKTIVLTGGA